MRNFWVVSLLLTACASMRVHPHDVERQFADDLGSVWLRVPGKDDLSPARAANPTKVMHKTEQLASEFLAGQGERTSLQSNYVRALLACTYLAQGRTDSARTVMRGIKTRRTEALARENAVIFCTVHAVDACRAIEAREALDRLFQGKLSAAEFVQMHGGFVGINLPPPGMPEYPDLVKLEAAKINGVKDQEEVRRDLRRMVAEHVYNELASLLVTLPPPEPPRIRPAERWLAVVVVGLLIDYGYLIPDVLPMRLSQAQKTWQLEQILPVYRRGKDISGYFLSAAERRSIAGSGLRVKDVRDNQDAHRALYQRLLNAEISVQGWIRTR